MPAFDDGIDGNAEEGEKRPEERDDYPASKEVAGEFVSGSVETRMGC